MRSIGRLGVALLLGGTLAPGCGGEPEPAEGTEAIQLSVTTTAEGVRSRFGGELELPDDFPEDLPVPEGARPTASIASGGRGWMVTLESDESAEALLAFYRERLKAAGWKVEHAVELPGQSMLTLAKGERKASVAITGGRSGAQLALTSTP